MSHEKLHQEAIRWYRQGWDDLEAAQALILAKKFAQACFYAQQSAEKSLKAVWISLDGDPWGGFYSTGSGISPRRRRANFVPRPSMVTGGMICRRLSL
jgi:hypothetical protein